MDTTQGKPRANGQRQRVTLPLDNLERAATVQAIEALLSGVTGVRYVYVNALMEMAYVEYDPRVTDRRRLAALLAVAGFGPPET